ncbi:MAG: class I SAM-dependent DNA methyltransferase [Elainellaceae cyanobacterium]
MAENEAFYDNPDALAQYRAHRSKPDNPNNTLERPVFLELAGNLTNLEIIDLGCGDASFGREALRKGAKSYTGIEISEVMVAIAQQTLANTPGRVHHQRIESWQPLDESANLVCSRLALNYVENLELVFQKSYIALRPNGRFIFSIEHPVITSNFDSLATGHRTNWLVDNYFKPGPRKHIWLGQEVTKYHHTLEEYVELTKSANFTLEQLRESRPRKKDFSSQEEYERRLRIPMFLFISAKK